MPFTGRWHFVNHRIPAHYRHCFWILERTAIMVWIPYPAMSKVIMSSLNKYHWLSHPCFPFSDSTCPLDQSPKSDGNPGVLDQWRHVQSLKCLHLAWYKPSYYILLSGFILERSFIHPDLYWKANHQNSAMRAVAKQISLYSITEARWKHEVLQNLSDSTEQTHSHRPGNCVEQHWLLLPFTGPHRRQPSTRLESRDFTMERGSLVP